jgi:hypothetical protein
MGQAKLRKQQLGEAYGNPEYAYHYTLSHCIPSILATGLRNTWGDDDLVWFTTSETVDPTSRPGLWHSLDNGKPNINRIRAAVLLNHDGNNHLVEEFFGIWRIKVPATKLVKFSTVKKTLSKDYEKDLRGSQPHRWYVIAPAGLSIDDYQWEQLQGDGSWVEADPTKVQVTPYHLPVDAIYGSYDEMTEAAREQLENGNTGFVLLKSGGMCINQERLKQSRDDYDGSAILI